MINGIIDSIQGLMHEARREREMKARAKQIAKEYLDREDEDWTFADPEEIKLLANSVVRYVD